MGDEREHPYDHTPLPKEVLRGELVSVPHLRAVDECAELDVELRLGLSALDQISTAFIAGVTIVFGIVALNLTITLTEPLLGQEPADGRSVALHGDLAAELLVVVWGQFPQQAAEGDYLVAWLRSQPRRVTDEWHRQVDCRESREDASLGRTTSPETGACRSAAAVPDAVRLFSTRDLSRKDDRNGQHREEEHGSAR